MRIAVMLLLGAYVLGTIGCGPANHSEKPPVEKEADGHDHEHHHHGPHDGHMAAMGDHEYHVEWTHDDASGKVTLYVLDGDAKKDVPIEASELVLVTKQGEETKEYTLSAVSPIDGKTAQFETTDKELVGTLEALSEQVTAEVKSIEVGGKTFSNVKLTEDEHHH